MAADENKKIRRKVRNAYIISTISIALVLFLLGTVSYLIFGALNASDQLKESMTINVMLKDSLPQEEVNLIQKKLYAHVNVKEVKFVSKEQAADDFKAYIGDDFVEFLQQNPLPDSFEITLNADASDKDVISAMENEIMTWQGIDEVVYQRNVVDQITSNLNKFNLVLLVFGGALLFISLILLNNTIRVTIFSRRYIINTMNLVGATRGFIMRPFLLNSLLHGLYAGLIASAMLVLMIAGLNEGLPEISFVRNNLQLLIIFAGMIVGGMLISLLFTTFAVSKFIRMNSGNIYIY